jgi:hypothetical protein
MSTIVKCDVCGQICNQSYLSAHKRLAHKKPEPVASHEPETVQAILLLYGQLSETSQEIIRERLLVTRMEGQRAASNGERRGRRAKERVQ